MLTIFDKSYDSESLYDVGRDVAEALCADYNPIVESIPKCDGFHTGMFRVIVEWVE